jgi:hypothetical protein
LGQLEIYEDVIVDICTVRKLLHVTVEWGVETSFNYLNTRQAHSEFHSDSYGSVNVRKTLLLNSNVAY